MHANNPKTYSCYGLKLNSYKEFDKKFLRLENFPPPPPPNNFSNGPSLTTSSLQEKAPWERGWE